MSTISQRTDSTCRFWHGVSRAHAFLGDCVFVVYLAINLWQGDENTEVTKIYIHLNPSWALGERRRILAGTPDTGTVARAMMIRLIAWVHTILTVHFSKQFKIKAAIDSYIIEPNVFRILLSILFDHRLLSSSTVPYYGRDYLRFRLLASSSSAIHNYVEIFGSPSPCTVESSIFSHFSLDVCTIHFHGLLNSTSRSDCGLMND